MKKPDITKGNWQVVKSNNTKFGVRSDKGFICFLVDPGGFDEWENYLSDAKGISAVPEMIDALFEMRSYLQICRTNFEKEGLDESVKYTDKKLEKVEKALIKAGCHE